MNLSKEQREVLVEARTILQDWKKHSTYALRAWMGIDEFLDARMKYGRELDGNKFGDGLDGNKED